MIAPSTQGFPMAIVGIDENGLGPRLGPLVVTSVLALCESARAAKQAASKPNKGLSGWIGDSKKLVGFSDTKLGEAWARVLFRDEHGRDAASIRELVEGLCLESSKRRTSLCPSFSGGASLRVQCWHDKDGPFLADEELLTAVSRIRSKLAKSGFATLHARSMVACTKQINRAASEGRSRLLVDLHAMEHLLLDAHAFAKGELAVTCGKVGGYNVYSEHFGPLASYLRSTVVESKAKSTYLFPALGSVSFVRDADANHLLVSLSSLLGKWLRDVLMRRIVTFYQETDPLLAPVSGYNDPVTNRFVKLTRKQRIHALIPDTCFEREKAK